MAYYDETPKIKHTKFIGSRKERRLKKKESLEFHVVSCSFEFLVFSFLSVFFSFVLLSTSQRFPSAFRKTLKTGSGYACMHRFRTPRPKMQSQKIYIKEV